MPLTELLKVTAVVAVPLHAVWLVGVTVITGNGLTVMLVPADVAEQELPLVTVTE